MKDFSKGLLLLLFIISLIVIGCSEVTEGSGSGNGGGSSSTENIDNSSTGTGTVEGTIDDDATVTIDQSDGTSQTTTTTEEDPDFIFEDVPEGEATITVENSDGETTSQTVQVNDGETTQVNPFGSTQEMENSLLAKVFEVPNKGWSTKVNDISDTQLGEDFYSKEINVPQRSFSEGFPGITDRFEWFGIVYEGQITAPVDGTYTFIIQCDDGAVLWIGGNKVVNGDGVHPTKTYQGTIDLTAGETYTFLLKYFQGPRYHITLVLKNQIPGEEIKLFNSDDYAE